jgi:hypothetical protein
LRLAASGRKIRDNAAKAEVKLRADLTAAHQKELSEVERKAAAE